MSRKLIGPEPRPGSLIPSEVKYSPRGGNQAQYTSDCAWYFTERSRSVRLSALMRLSARKNTSRFVADMAANGEVEGPRRTARLEPRAQNRFPRPRRRYRLSRHPPTIVRRHGSAPLLSDTPRARSQGGSRASKVRRRRDKNRP